MAWWLMGGRERRLSLAGAQGGFGVFCVLCACAVWVVLVPGCSCWGWRVVDGGEEAGWE